VKAARPAWGRAFGTRPALAGVLETTSAAQPAWAASFQKPS